MNITLYQYEVVEAIQEYLTQKYDMDVDLQDNFVDCPCIKYIEIETPYKVISMLLLVMHTIFLVWKMNCIMQ